MEAFTALLSALEDIIPMLVHVQCALSAMTCHFAPPRGILQQHRVVAAGEHGTNSLFLVCRLLLFPPSPTPKPTASSGERVQSEISTSRAGAGNSTATTKPSISTDQSSDITYTWENTCVFNISKNNKLAVEPDHPWPLIGSAAFCCAMVTRSVLRTSNYNLLVCRLHGIPLSRTHYVVPVFALFTRSYLWIAAVRNTFMCLQLDEVPPALAVHFTASQHTHPERP